MNRTFKRTPPTSPIQPTVTVPNVLLPRIQPIDEKDGEAINIKPFFPSGKGTGSSPSSHYEDPTSKIWSIYVSEAGVHDKGLVESWKSDMDGILIFAGLFSASVTAFIVESYKNLSPDSGDITVALLVQISEQLKNSSQATTPLALKSFRPTQSAIRVNAFWILSLCFALACALAATLIQQFSRNYLSAIERRPAPHKKARVRSFLYQGIESFSMPAVVESIPMLLHISVFLFFIGLADFFLSINHVIAYITLTIIAICVILYILMTLLPIVRHHCPYRTPLSGMCWRVLQFMGLLRYNDRGIWRRIRGSMAQGREMLAAADLPGRDQRDFQALSWTMESLTEDNELEPFVEGIPGFLQWSSQEAPSVLEQLMRRDDVAIFERITKLLMTCTESGGLSGTPRRKRAIACMNAISALVVSVENEDWMSLDFFDDTLRETFNLLKYDSDFAIATAAVGNMEILAAKLQRYIKNGLKKSYASSLNAIEHSLATTTALETLYQWDQLDPIIEKISDSTLEVTRGPNQNLVVNLVVTCRTRYIPDLLTTCYAEGALEEVDRESRALACIKATFYSTGLGSGPPFDLSTAEALAILRGDKITVIAHYAACATARVACHLQSDIVQSLWDRRYIGSLAHYSEAFNRLGILNELLSNVASDMGSRPGHGGPERLRLQLSCFSSPNNDELDDMWAFMQGKVGQMKALCHSLQPDELQLLDKLELRPSKSQSSAKCPSQGKAALSRGHVVVFISLLYHMKTSPIPAEALEFTLKTLNFVADNLTARFSSHTAQALVVDYAGEYLRLQSPTPAADNAETDGSSEMDEPGTDEEIMNVIFDVLGTIGDPNVADGAKAILNSHLAIRPNSAAAAKALQKLEETPPLEPLD